jgi:hypothetical protein
MTDVEEAQLAVRFANFLRTNVPHRARCNRTKGTSHRCNCDIGEPSLQVYNKFLELIDLAGKGQP